MSSGLHDVPMRPERAKLARLFRLGLPAALQMVETASVYDNSFHTPVLIAKKERGEIVVAVEAPSCTCRTGALAGPTRSKARPAKAAWVCATRPVASTSTWTTSTT